jgi:hypothetical protein
VACGLPPIAAVFAFAAAPAYGNASPGTPDLGVAARPPDAQSRTMDRSSDDLSDEVIIECDVDDAAGQDCNANGVRDECDIAEFGWQFALNFEFVTAQHATSYWRGVSISGDTAVVAVESLVHVFVHDSGVWRKQATLDLGYWARSVSVSDDTVVVGTYNPPCEPGLPSSCGAAQIFVRSGGVWAKSDELIADDVVNPGWFADSVSISGDTIVVGAPSREHPIAGERAGAAYVFVRSTDGTWTQQAKLVADDAAADTEFGHSVAIDGDRAVIGGWRDRSDRGSAYVFVRDGRVWAQEGKLIAEDPEPSALLGHSVAISGDTVIASAWGDRGGLGAAYVFVRSRDVWSQEAKLVAPDAAAGRDWFGYSVAISGDKVAVGASPGYAGNDRPGSLYLFARSEGVWTQQGARRFSLDSSPNDRFGISVAISDETAVVGGLPNDDGSGRAYAFSHFSADINGDGVPDECDIVIPGEPRRQPPRNPLNLCGLGATASVCACLASLATFRRQSSRTLR